MIGNFEYCSYHQSVGYNKKSFSMLVVLQLYDTRRDVHLYLTD